MCFEEIVFSFWGDKLHRASIDFADIQQRRSQGPQQHLKWRAFQKYLMT